MSNAEQSNSSMILSKLQQTILERKQNPTANSYTARLFSAGIEEISKKVGEEAVEVVVAALHQSDERLVSECADVVYHLLVLLAERKLSFQDVEKELERRHR